MPDQTSALAGATIVFDLDGTLIDTAPDLARAANVALGAEGRPAVPIESLRGFVGHGGRRLIAEGLEATGGPVPPTRLDALLEIFLAHYSAHIAEDSRPFPGALACLDRLADAGAHLAICTNKREGLARQLFDALDLTARFGAIVGGDTMGVAKPDAAPLLAAIERAGGTRARAVMVGDTPTDVGAARAADVPVVAVSFGYAKGDPAAMGADALIDHFDGLDAAAARLLGMAA